MKLGLVKTIGAKAGKVACRTGLKLKKASPEIMLAGGLIAAVGTVVAACVATKKLVEDEDHVLENTHKELDDIQKEYEKNVQDDGSEDSGKKKHYISVKKRKSFKVYRKLCVKLAKTYGLSAFLLLLSVGLILGSHGILKKRYVSTTLAYKALDEAFKDYRERIKEAVGEEKERHFFNGTEECGEVTVIDENGDAKTTKDIQKVHKKKNSPYEFDWNARTAPGNWQANSDYNLAYLKGIQNWLNDLLHARGHVFMNEALDALGLTRTSEGAVCGWLLGSGGDDFVDLGISEYYSDELVDIQDGKIKNIHLNLNVDGLIWDKI